MVALDDVDTSQPAYNGLTVVKPQGKDLTQVFTEMMGPILNWLKSGVDDLAFFSDTTVNLFACT